MGAGGKEDAWQMSDIDMAVLYTFVMCYSSFVFICQKNTCILPEDLRDFYLTTDSFTLTWSVKLDSRCPDVVCLHSQFSKEKKSLFLFKLF